MERRRRHERGLVMSPGRKIPRSPSPPPKRPPPPEDSGVDVPPEVSKAAGELTALAAAIRSCEACTRRGEARAYGTGYPRAMVMLVKDRPSEADLETGNAFTSEAEPLGKAFEALGIPLSWVYGATAVRSGSTEASAEETRACSEHLITEIEIIRPRVIVAFGSRSVDAIRALNGKCGVNVPDDVPSGQAVAVRADLMLLATEELPDGVTAKDAKRRLWRDLQAIPKLIGA